MKARLCFVSHMLGRHPGYITTQGQILADLFEDAGYCVTSVSSHLSKHRRLADVVSTLVRQRAEIDVMVVDIYGGPSFVMEDVASQLGRRFGHRIVMMLHGGAMPTFMARYPGWTKRVLSRADVIAAPSRFLARAVEKYGFRARVIPNVIDLSAYKYRQRQRLSPRLFWMRSFHPLYNPKMAVRVLACLRSTRPEASLAIAGSDKGFEAEVRRQAEELNLNGAIRFVGFLNAEGKSA